VHPKRNSRTLSESSNRCEATQCPNNRPLKCDDGIKKSSTARTILKCHSKLMQVVSKAQTNKANNQVYNQKDQYNVIRDDHTKCKHNDRTTREDEKFQDFLPDDVPIIEHHEIHKEESIYRVMPISRGESIRAPYPT